MDVTIIDYCVLLYRNILQKIERNADFATLLDILAHAATRFSSVALIHFVQFSLGESNVVLHQYFSLLGDRNNYCNCLNLVAIGVGSKMSKCGRIVISIC